MLEKHSAMSQSTRELDIMSDQELGLRQTHQKLREPALPGRV